MPDWLGDEATGGARVRVVRSRAAKARYAKRRAGRMKRADNDLTPGQWVAIKAAWGGCAYCGVGEGVLQKDCVLPLSRGGRYTVENVVPACRSCNASKGNEEVTHWLRRKRLDEAAFLLRFREMGLVLANLSGDQEEAGVERIGEL